MVLHSLVSKEIPLYSWMMQGDLPYLNNYVIVKYTQAPQAPHYPVEAPYLIKVRGTSICRSILNVDRREELVRCLENGECDGVAAPTNVEIFELVGEMWNK